jgi:hypothetical protein
MLVASTGASAAGLSLFEKVPQSNAAYVELAQLAKDNLLKKDEVRYPLTRYEVAQDILQANRNLETQKSHSTPFFDSDLKIDQTDLTSLQQAYQAEVAAVKKDVQKLQKEEQTLNLREYRIFKKLNNDIIFGHAIRVDGSGVFWMVPYSKEYGLGLAYPFSNRYFQTVLNLNASVEVAPQVNWKSEFQILANEPQQSVTILLRRMTIHLDPSFMSMDIGDFYQAYTPLTLWNRDDLDLEYKPETLNRIDEYPKSLVYLNHEPEYPLRGLKVGTRIFWPQSPAVKSFNISVFADMVNNNYQIGGTYVGTTFNNWIFGGKGVLSFRKYLTISGYAVLYDVPFNSNPTVTYNPNVPTLWAQQYQVGSVVPNLKIPVAAGVTIGVKMELADALLRDDIFNSGRNVSGPAVIGGPNIQFGRSIIQLNYIRISPSYYSPLAQLRQYDSYDATTAAFSAFAPGLLGFPFFTQITDPSGIYRFYNRLTDNVFPYGLATPDRQGIGVQFALHFLHNLKLQIPGKIYFVSEISGNMVVNKSGTEFVSLENPTSTTPVIRHFIYVNIGPQIHLQHVLNLDQPFNVGLNIRDENTQSSIGNLNSIGVILGIDRRIVPKWWLEVGTGPFHSQGVESGYEGTPTAQYTFWFDNGDLGDFSNFSINESNWEYFLSNTFSITKQSKLYLDWIVEKVNSAFSTNGSNQNLSTVTNTVDAEYAIKF